MLLYGVLQLCDLFEDKVYREFFSEAEQLPVSGAASSCAGVLNEATVDMMVLVALEQFEN